jgi:Insulin/IGF/Relaxin family
MHFQRKSEHNKCSYGIKVLLIVLVTYASSASSSGITPEDIAEAMKDISIISDTMPFNYCGKRLTGAMKTFCHPAIRSAILRGSPVGSVSKKSCELSVEDKLMAQSDFLNLLPLPVDFNSDVDFEQFDLDRVAENYEDELSRSRYKLDDSSLYSKDFPFVISPQGNRRRRRGIIDECCKRACYKTELVMYCPNTQG